MRWRMTGLKSRSWNIIEHDIVRDLERPWRVSEVINSQAYKGCDMEEPIGFPLVLLLTP